MATPPARRTAATAVTSSSSPSGLTRGGSLNSKQSSTSGCEIPFVPAGGGSSLTRFKQLSTRRSHPTRPKMAAASPHKHRTVSSPSLTEAMADEEKKEPEASSAQQPRCQATNGNNNNNQKTTASMVVSSALQQPFISPPHWAVMDELEDHPGRRKSSGFLQPIKHLSGRYVSQICMLRMQMVP
jgi:hypothetical protein